METAITRKIGNILAIRYEARIRKNGMDKRSTVASWGYREELITQERLI